MPTIAQTKNLILLDCGQTLTTIEGQDELARIKGMSNEIAQITEFGMNGVIDFRTSFSRRIELLRPSLQETQILGQLYIDTMTEGVREVIADLRSRGFEIFIVSGGLLPSLKIIANKLDIPSDNVFGVDIYFDDKGMYKDYDKGSLLLNPKGKKDVVEKLIQKYRNEYGPNVYLKTIFVGDGATDLHTKDVVDLFIGFGGVVQRSVVKNNCEFFVESRSLMGILPFIENVF